MTVNEPGTLADSSEKERRMKRLSEPHIRQLTYFVKQISSDPKYPGEAIPFFDPDDGGVDAKCLFIFQDPGPKALESCFVSRDNPDPSAKEFFRLNCEAGLPRKITASWNVIPWHVESIDADTRQKGIECLNYLLPHFNNLKVIVLCGREAQRAAKSIYDNRREVLVLFMPHPGQRVLNRWPEKRQQICSILKLLAKSIESL